jgi:hypothetical protein
MVCPRAKIHSAKPESTDFKNFGGLSVEPRNGAVFNLHGQNERNVLLVRIRILRGRRKTYRSRFPHIRPIRQGFPLRLYQGFSVRSGLDLEYTENTCFPLSPQESASRAVSPFWRISAVFAGQRSCSVCLCVPGRRFVRSGLCDRPRTGSTPWLKPCRWVFVT